MKKFIVIFVLLGLGLAGGYFYLHQKKEEFGSNGSVNQVKDTVMTGKLQKAGDRYHLSLSSGETQPIDSYSLNLEEYVGQRVEATGQFSGDELFVSKLELVN